jgi:hypothetical protein
VSAKLLEVFQRIAQLYFERWSSLRAIDAELNTNPTAPTKLRPLTWQRCSTGIIVARLVGRPNYEQLATVYTSEMKDRDRFYLKYFLPLLDSLQTVEPWSGVPEKLARPLAEVASSTAPGTLEYPEIEPLPSTGLTPENANFTGKYDDASWHYGGDFPKDLPIEAGATHTGMFLAWALLAGLGGELHDDETPNLFEQLRARTITPGAFFMSACDGKFTDEDLNDEGNAFAQDYFVFETGLFLHDYETTVGADLPDLYHVPDTWGTFEQVKSVLDQRFHEWKTKTEKQQKNGRS